jgi:hypothetical protein
MQATPTIGLDIAKSVFQVHVRAVNAGLRCLNRSNMATLSVSAQ